MSELAIGSVLSVLTSLALWALLPRGVVLTRSVRTSDFRGEPLYDTWELKNDSALPIRLTRVTVSGVNTVDEAGRIREEELPIFEGDRDLGVSLTFDDETLEIRRTDRGQRWRGLVVPPGDTLEAKVLTNRMLRVRYRRAGPLGVFERRELKIFGYA